MSTGVSDGSPSEEKGFGALWEVWRVQDLLVKEDSMWLKRKSFERKVLLWLRRGKTCAHQDTEANKIKKQKTKQSEGNAFVTLANESGERDLPNKARSLATETTERR